MSSPLSPPASSPPAPGMSNSEDLRMFASLEDYVKAVGGKRVLKKILVASNVRCVYICLCVCVSMCLFILCRCVSALSHHVFMRMRAVL
jgi:hypothetical protein